MGEPNANLSDTPDRPRSEAVREAKRIYSSGRAMKHAIRYCTEQLREPGADPELLLVRGLAYLDGGRPDEAVADWEKACEFPAVAGMAHLHLANFLSQKTAEHVPAALRHAEAAIALGYGDGYVLKGRMLMDVGFRARDEERDPEKAAGLFRRAVGEFDRALASPDVRVRWRAVMNRASARYNLGDVAGCERDHAEEKRLGDQVRRSVRG